MRRTVKSEVLSVKPRGFYYAVHDWLYRNTDIIWARPNPEFGIVFTKQATLRFYENDYVSVPKFASRGWQLGGTVTDTPTNNVWAIRNGANDVVAPWCFRSEYGLDYGMFGNGHSLVSVFITPAKYWKTHPEYFSQVGGKLTDPRNQSRKTQSPTNPEGWRQEGMDDYIRKIRGTKSTLRHQ